MEVSRGLEGGRTGRFRRRFGGAEEQNRQERNVKSEIEQGVNNDATKSTSGASGIATQAASDENSSASNRDENGNSSASATAAARTRNRSEVKFEKDDLDWMTGGTENKGKTKYLKNKKK